MTEWPEEIRQVSYEYRRRAVMTHLGHVGVHTITCSSEERAWPRSEEVGHPSAVLYRQHPVSALP